MYCGRKNIVIVYDVLILLMQLRC